MTYNIYGYFILRLYGFYSAIYMYFFLFIYIKNIFFINQLTTKGLKTRYDSLIARRQPYSEAIEYRYCAHTMINLPLILRGFWNFNLSLLLKKNIPVNSSNDVLAYLPYGKGQRI